MGRKFIKKIISTFVAHPFFLFRSSRFVRTYLNCEAVALIKENPPLLEGELGRVAEDLQRNGVAVTDLDVLFPGQGMLKTLHAYADVLRPSGKIRKGKPFLMALWPDNTELHLENPFTQVALSGRALAVVQAYLGMNPKFFYSYLDVTLPVLPGTPPFRSQNWHRDPEDRKMCKMFIYLSDVGEGAGPFVYLRGSHIDGRWGNVYPQNPPKGSYPSEEAVRSAIPKEAEFVCIGKAGAVVFADTAGLHRGGYATLDERLMFTADYSSPASLRSPLHALSEGFKNSLPQFQPAARYALSSENRFIARTLNAISNTFLKYGLY